MLFYIARTKMYHITLVLDACFVLLDLLKNFKNV